jgi:two-component system, LytTR family, response regulator
LKLNDGINITPTNITHDQITPNFLFVKVGSSTIKISYDEIHYIEGLKDYVRIYINDTKALITKCTIKYIEKKLSNNNFKRVHKSYIVSIDKIDKIEFNHVFIGSKKIPVGMQFKESFFDIIDIYRL